MQHEFEMQMQDKESVGNLQEKSDEKGKSFFKRY
jgi:hypothetical protein